MAIYDLWLSRNNGPTVSNYVGHEGRLFFDPAERVLRISNGSTAGGEVFNGIVTVANTAPATNFPGQIWLNPQTYDLSVYHNGAFLPTINVATSTNLGGVKLGPGVTTNESGQIIIDSTGLDFSFGDLASSVGTYTNESDYAILQTINTNEDMVLASNGTGGIHIVGEFRVHATNGTLTETLEDTPVFEIKSDGQIKILVPLVDSTEGAVSIVGSTTGEFISPVNTGVMLHVTGNYDAAGIPSRIYNDSQNAFGAWVTRRFNGTVSTPTAVLANQEIMRLSGTAHNGTTIPGTANQRIVYVALGNQTLTNQGGAIELWTTPINTTTIAKIATVDSVGITLESGKVLTGNVTGNVSGTAGSVAAANITGTTLAATVVTSSLTSVGTLTNLSVTNTITGSISGNASTVTNGVYTTGSYANPSWITSLAASKVGLGSVENTALSTWAGSSNITTVGTLTNLAIATGGTITTPRVIINDGGIRTISGGTTCTIDFATDSIILWTAPTGTAVITLSNYTAGATVKLIIAMTTSRDVTYGIASAANSSDGADNFNGSGGGSTNIANHAMHLDYTCISALAAGCYVAVTVN